MYFCRSTELKSVSPLLSTVLIDAITLTVPSLIVVITVERLLSLSREGGKEGEDRSPAGYHRRDGKSSG